MNKNKMLLKLINQLGENRLGEIFNDINKFKRVSRADTRTIVKYISDNYNLDRATAYDCLRVSY